MYSSFNHQIAQDRIADLHRQARQDAMARTARQADRPDQPRRGRRVLRLPLIAIRRALTA